MIQCIHGLKFLCVCLLLPIYSAFCSVQHNLCCDNCHSHVAMALNLMQYNRSSSWNMVKLCFFMLIYGKFTRYFTDKSCPL